MLNLSSVRLTYLFRKNKHNSGNSGNIQLFFFLGLYCNSPSACFVASDGQSLRLYQAVIEAKKLLSELSNPEISVSDQA